MLIQLATHNNTMSCFLFLCMLPFTNQAMQSRSAQEIVADLNVHHAVTLIAPQQHECGADKQAHW